MNHRFAKISTALIILLTVIVYSALSQNNLTDKKSVYNSDAEALLRNIAVDTVQKSITESKSLEEAAAKLSISVKELKELALVLKIKSPLLIEDKPVPPLSSESLLTNNLFGPERILAFGKGGGKVQRKNGGLKV